MGNPEGGNFDKNLEDLKSGRKVLRKMPDGTVGEFNSDKEAQEALKNWDSK